MARFEAGGSRGTSSVQAALGAGFAVVFTLWLLWGSQLVRSLHDIEFEVQRVQDSFATGEQELLAVRTDVLLGSIYLRDALIDAESPRHYRDELERLRLESEARASSALPRANSPEEREQWVRLQAELREYWASRNIAFEPDSRGTLEAARVLRTRIVPRREAVLEILDRLGELHVAANRRQQKELDAVYRSVGIRVLAMGGVTMVGALMVVIFAARRVNRLQRQIERQRLSEQRNRQDLERLSARLVEAQEQERRNLSRELHDAVGQALTAVKMDIGIALRAETSGRVREALEDAREITETTLRGVRDLSQLLHPSTLDDFGLPATLSAYLRSFSQRTGIRAQLMETLDSRLAPEVETCAYRIVQEALNNIARHSDARSCTVWLSIVSGTLHLRIEDDGKGLATVETGTGAARGLGLIGMRERAQTLGGAFHIETGHGEGTRLLVSVPLPQEQPLPPGQTDDADMDRLAG